MESLRVLLVDDNAVFLEALLGFLGQHENIDVVGKALNGKQAIQLATTLHPQIVLLDLAMPDMSGMDVIPCLRSASPEVGIIILSLHNLERYRAVVLAAGADEVVHKWTLSAELIPAIRRTAKAADLRRRVRSMNVNDVNDTPYRKTNGAVHLALHQGGNLHALSQASIDQDEAIRASVARELHDCLSELALLKKELATLNAPDELFKKWDRIINDIRGTVSDLRPKMLDFGIGAALRYLTYRLEDSTSNGTGINLEVNDDDCRYNPHAEQHIYRILQQACENAVQHARAKTITIRGSLESAQVDLAVEDDGVGFSAHRNSDLGTLVAQQHFGIAGMFERAQIINATLEIDSTPGQGTRIRLIWQPKTLARL